MCICPLLLNRHGILLDAYAVLRGGAFMVKFMFSLEQTAHAHDIKLSCPAGAVKSVLLQGGVGRRGGKH